MNKEHKPCKYEEYQDIVLTLPVSLLERISARLEKGESQKDFIKDAIYEKLAK